MPFDSAGFQAETKVALPLPEAVPRKMSQMLRLGIECIEQWQDLGGKYDWWAAYPHPVDRSICLGGAVFAVLQGCHPNDLKMPENYRHHVRDEGWDKVYNFLSYFGRGGVSPAYNLCAKKITGECNESLMGIFDALTNVVIDFNRDSPNYAATMQHCRVALEILEAHGL